MDVFFWQNMPSHIQSCGLDEFAKVWDGSVNCIWADSISTDRQALQWKTPNLFHCTQQFLDGKNALEKIQTLIDENSQAIHIFSGLEAYPKISSAFERAKSLSMPRLGLMVEPGIRLGIKGFFRPLRSRWLARRYLSSIQLILAMGKTGVAYYSKAGFDPALIFPYMYQAPETWSSGEGLPLDHHASSRENGDAVKLVYVGKFGRRKGIDVLVKALGRVQDHPFVLTVIGDGAELGSLKNLAQSLGIGEQIRWLGAQPHAVIGEILLESDLCIVPSRFEGWGVVVNEAISAGLPVICSDKTTSKDLVDFGQCGVVFRSGSVADLASKLAILLADSSSLASMRRNAMVYRQSISPRVVGCYLANVMRHRFMGADRPNAPWMQNDPS
ncbi:Glycogen synthase [Stieleria bergensis]|uniref:Glycogen synthase n=1 Tax=Stieleria bergensis TaxID=2528025 RepID=A0A517SSS4_9BACT|nr:Glycogen synthase [Planctomycetes bacterium SV_7m_r]